MNLPAGVGHPGALDRHPPAPLRRGRAGDVDQAHLRGRAGARPEGQALPPKFLLTYKFYPRPSSLIPESGTLHPESYILDPALKGEPRP